jgi:hypothetical protein
MDEQAVALTPRQVRIAAILFWVTLAIQVPAALASVPHSWNLAEVAVFAVDIGFIAITAVSIVYLVRGRRWARVTLSVLFAMSLLAVPAMALVFTESPVLASLVLAQVAVQAVALYLVYSQPGAAHFRASPGNDAAMRAVLPIGRSGWAIAAGYLALISVLIVPAPFALACGIMAIRDIRRDPSKHGMGRAIFGVVMGSLGILAAAALYLLAHR